MIRGFALVSVVVVLATCGSPIRSVVLPPSEWRNADAGEMPDPAAYCPPSSASGVCVPEGGEVTRSEGGCQQRYEQEAWRRSKALAESKQGLVPVDVPLATLTVTSARGESKVLPDSEWTETNKELLQPLTEAGKARFGDTLVVPNSGWSGLPYLARLHDAYVLVVPEYRQRETRIVTVCTPKCPHYGLPIEMPTTTTKKAFVLPAGAMFGGVIKLPVYTFSTTWQPKDLWTNDDRRSCPAPPP